MKTGTYSTDTKSEIELIIKQVDIQIEALELIRKRLVLLLSKEKKKWIGK